ncbi:hypothetical protein P7K49_039412 [Saguinus oedipus]|uniref:Uncharacterized protein n=1 Tax=Saguinus oedipus TaxID=9490 RepID=A0ABQ9TBQ8_SAGOE|nr:hypothetical protein P7K49_039412 [Saguinus oedipus]
MDAIRVSPRSTTATPSAFLTSPRDPNADRITENVGESPRGAQRPKRNKLSHYQNEEHVTPGEAPHHLGGEPPMQGLRVRDKRSGAIRHERPSLAPRAGQEERCHSPRTSVPCPACGTRGAVPFATNVRPLPRVHDKRSGAIRHELKQWIHDAVSAFNRPCSGEGTASHTTGPKQSQLSQCRSEECVDAGTSSPAPRRGDAHARQGRHAVSEDTNGCTM